jgi:hypothetical protein
VRRGVGGLAVVVALAAPVGAAAAPAFPRAVITSGPAGEVENSDATFTFEASQPPLLSSPHFECRVDGGGWAACTSPVVLGGFGGGSHMFAVRMSGVFDDQTPDERTWIVRQKTVVAPPPLTPSQQPPPPRDKPAPRYAVDGCDYGAAGPGRRRSACSTAFAQTTACNRCAAAPASACWRRATRACWRG